MVTLCLNELFCTLYSNLIFATAHYHYLHFANIKFTSPSGYNITNVFLFLSIHIENKIILFTKRCRDQVLYLYICLKNKTAAY